MATVKGKRVLLKNLQGEYLLPYNGASGSGNPDDQTIKLNDDNQLVAFGNETKDGNLNYDWFGTLEEYQAAVTAGTIQDNWTCFIYDYSTQDIVDITRLSKVACPYTLLEPRYFQKDPQNPCWLQPAPNGAFQDGTIYTDVYDAIITELDTSIQVGQANINGYVKQGLPCKYFTDTYTEEDYVVNPATHQFKFPTKVKIAGGNRVKGDGYSLGLFDGVNELGLNASSQDHMLTGRTGSLNVPLTATTNNNTGILTRSNGAVGVTSDPSKSGMIVDDSELVLCFYVGEVIKDLQVINGGAALKALENKVNLDLTNLPDTSKSQIAGYPMPSGRYIDLTLGASGTTYTAPANGWFRLRKITGGNNQYVEMWSNSRVATISHAPTVNNACSVFLPVKKGEVVTIGYTASGTTQNFQFVFADGSKND